MVFKQTMKTHKMTTFAFKPRVLLNGPILRREKNNNTNWAALVEWFIRAGVESVVISENLCLKINKNHQDMTCAVHTKEQSLDLDIVYIVKHIQLGLLPKQHHHFKRNKRWNTQNCS